MFQKTSALYGKINLKISEIGECLKSMPYNSHDISLMGGETGKTLFFLYKYLLNKDKEDLYYLVTNLGQINLSIQASNTIDGSLSKGLVGYGWLLNQIISLDLLSFENEDIIFEVLDKKVREFINVALNKHYWDFLHGAMGCSLYLFTRIHIQSNRLAIEEIIYNFYNTAVVQDGCYFWYMNSDLHKVHPENTVNLGAAHGLPAILKFLTICIRNNICAEQSTLMARGIIKKIMSSYQDFSKFGSCFPTVVNDSVTNSKSRLGWCYGDLGISYILHTSALTLGDRLTMNYAVNILKLQTQRQNLLEESILDGGLCHGTAGIALIFQNIYKSTKHPIFRKASIFWLEETLKMSKYDDGLAGYKTVKKIGNSTHILSPGFLEGVSGTGLALISSLSRKPQLWTEALLLNN